jgi:hypothetical protein
MMTPKHAIPWLTLMVLGLAPVVQGQEAAVRSEPVAADAPRSATKTPAPARCDPDQNADCRSYVAAKKRAAIPAKTAAPIDLTGYWEAVVTEDWRWRMMTAPRGDFASIPLTDEGVRTGMLWDPVKDAHNCKEFGAAGLLRNPLRIDVSWADEQTLQLRTDHGMQTRLFHFDRTEHPAGIAPSMQGDSIAQWETSALKVRTTDLLPGYVRKNGVPYSAKTVLTEYFDRFTAFGTDWLMVTTIVHDPINFSRDFITSSHFKKLPDGSSWHPTPCRS